MNVLLACPTGIPFWKSVYFRKYFKNQQCSVLNLIRLLYWLQLLVVRCGVIIDDFMNADCVASELRQQHKERENLLR